MLLSKNYCSFLASYTCILDVIVFQINKITDDGDGSKLVHFFSFFFLTKGGNKTKQREGVWTEKKKKEAVQLAYLCIKGTFQSRRGSNMWKPCCTFWPLWMLKQTKSSNCVVMSLLSTYQRNAILLGQTGSQFFSLHPFSFVIIMLIKNSDKSIHVLM